MSLENLETSDYLREGDIGFKKPKVGSTGACLSKLGTHSFTRPRRSVLLDGQRSMLVTTVVTRKRTRWKWTRSQSLGHVS